jgi:hypothetical protein
MTTQTDRLSGWDRALIAARWCRDKAAEFIVKFWLYVILWSVVAIAFTVLLYIDGKFSRGLAEGLDDIDPFSFQAMGWAYRLFAAAFLMAGAVCIVKGIKGAFTFRALGVFASVIVCLHAFGFGFQALQDRRDDALAVREVVALQANNSAEQIALLREQITATREDRDRQVDRLQASINGIVSDGLNNDHLADDYRKDQTQAEADAKAKIDAAEREISRLASEGNAAKQNVATITADEKPWPALYIGMAQLATWSKEPTDWAIYLCGVGFIIGWVLLAESLVIFLPERIYLMHLKDAEGRDVVHLGPSHDVPAGHVRVEVPEDEWQAMQEAMRIHGNIKTGAKKGAKTRRQGNKIEAAGDYYRERISEFMVAHNTGLSTAQIAARAGLTVASLRASYLPHMSLEEQTALFGTGFVDEPEPEPPVVGTADEPEPPVAMADSPLVEDEPEPEPEIEAEAEPEAIEDEADDDELSIPDEPKEWGLAVYDSDLNNTDTDEGAKRDELV